MFIDNEKKTRFFIAGKCYGKSKRKTSHLHIKQTRANGYSLAHFSFICFDHIIIMQISLFTSQSKQQKRNSQ